MSFFESEFVQAGSIEGYAYGGDEQGIAEDPDFNDFEEMDPDEYRIGVVHQQHMGIIDPIYGTNIQGMGGRNYDIPREKIWLREFRFELERYFDSYELLDSYVSLAEKLIPRYWTRNAYVLAKAIDFVHYNPDFTPKQFQRITEKRLSDADVLRYVFLVKQYLGANLATV